MQDTDSGQMADEAVARLPDSGAAVSGGRRGHRVPALRRRTIFDTLLVVGIAILLSQPSALPDSSMKLAIIATSVGLLLYFVRRRNDLTELKQDMDQCDQDVSRRGISLSEWQGGAPLPPWHERFK